MTLQKFICYFILIIFLVGCSSDDEPTVTPTPTPMPDPEPVTPMVMLGNDGILGSILTDENGMTLYYFSKDASGESTCIGGCLDNWPIYNIENLAVGSGLDATDFTTLTRSDGATQTAYKGWPLYYFANDTSAGQTNGEDVGGVWYVAKPDYALMLTNSQLVGADGVNYNSSYEPGDEEVQYFVDASGRTLYAFQFDAFEMNNYTMEDFSNDPTWPIFDAQTSNYPSSLDESLFTKIDVHGRSQLTYKGWPLYYFGGDEMVRGSNKGISVPTPGVWPIVFKDIEAAEVNCNTEEVKFSESIQPLINSTCATSGCHSGSTPAAGILLSTYDGVKEIADSGQLVGTVAWEMGFSRMPRNQDQLDQCTIEMITAWVDAGALDN